MHTEAGVSPTAADSRKEIMGEKRVETVRIGFKKTHKELLKWLEIYIKQGPPVKFRMKFWDSETNIFWPILFSLIIKKNIWDSESIRHTLVKICSCKSRRNLK